MSDTALQRKNMVESQVRPSDVTDRRVTAAMQKIARENFVPGALASLAYQDDAIAVGPGKTLLAPRDLARLLQLASINTGDKVLVAGTAPAYTAALVAEMGAAQVVVLEPDMEAGGQQASEAITRVSGPLASGWPAAGPYNVILIEGLVERVPDALTKQLATGGRLVAVELDRGVGRALLVRNTGGALARSHVFEANAPRLAGFEAARPAFQL